jgi:hypothetical protein
VYVVSHVVFLSNVSSLSHTHTHILLLQDKSKNGDEKKSDRKEKKKDRKKVCVSIIHEIL